MTGDLILAAVLGGLTGLLLTGDLVVAGVLGGLTALVAWRDSRRRRPHPLEGIHHHLDQERRTDG